MKTKRIKKKPINELMFENDRYKITHIPLNYFIQVKVKDAKGKKILRDFYSPDDRNLEYAKEMAEHMINKAFTAT